MISQFITPITSRLSIFINRLTASRALKLDNLDTKISDGKFDTVERGEYLYQNNISGASGFNKVIISIPITILSANKYLRYSLRTPNLTYYLNNSMYHSAMAYISGGNIVVELYYTWSSDPGGALIDIAYISWEIAGWK
jgi:restriction endonuclease S subunit